LDLSALSSKKDLSHCLAGLLQDPEYFHNYTLVNWAALTWKAHLDARAFFNHKGVGLRAMALAWHTILDIASNYKFGAEVLPCLDHPVLLQVRPQAGDPHGPSGIQWNLLEGGPRQMPEAKQSYNCMNPGICPRSHDGGSALPP
jgi:hypothetical protein